MPAIITIHRLQGKRKQDVSCWWWEKKKNCCDVAQVSEYTSCPAIYLFIYFCRGTLIGSHIRALLKDFVAPHRPAAEITCRPLKVKYQQVLSLIKASRMSRVFFFFLHSCGGTQMRLGSQPGSECTKVIQSDAWQHTLWNCLSLWVASDVHRETQRANIMWETAESMYVTRVNHNTELHAASVTTTLHLVLRGSQRVGVSPLTSAEKGM